LSSQEVKTEKSEKPQVAETPTESMITIDRAAFQKLNWAMKKGESYTDVILRLISTKLDGLQRRGEKEVVTRDNRRLILNVDQAKCLGAESCAALAPMVFALDLSHFKDGEPLAFRDIMDRTVDSDTIVRAAISCPYKAIFVKDAESGEELSP
jgi:ferredoxin/predicted CopG family antitoxin